MMLKRTLFVTAMVMFMVLLSAYALAETTISPSQIYEYKNEENYAIASKTKSVSVFSNGRKQIGRLSISTSKDTDYQGISMYSSASDITLWYTYDGKSNDQSFGKWYIDLDNAKTVCGYDLGFTHNVGHGTILVERSNNGQKWELAREPITDYFTKSRGYKDAQLLTVANKDLVNGIYLRVTVVYKIAKQTKDGFAFFGDEWTTRRCIERYEMFLCSTKDAVMLKDLGSSGKILKNQNHVQSGFYLDPNGSNATINVEHNGNKALVNGFKMFTEKGEYRIKVKTRWNKEFTYSIYVDSGSLSKYIDGKTLKNEQEYKLPSAGNGASSARITNLMLSVPADAEIEEGWVKNNKAYGVKASNVSLYLTLNKDGTAPSLISDSWGRKHGQEIAGAETGEVGKGALIIQTSKNSVNWSNVDKGRYAKGLYTTDFMTHYGKNSPVLIYSPDGKDINDGIYIRVIFAYQEKDAASKKTYRHTEMYTFYLCNNNLDAVTFHNMTVAENNLLEKAEDEFTAEVYCSTETLEDQACTVTGIEIDPSLAQCMKVTYSVNDGKSCSVNEKKTQLTETGEYRITVESPLGNKKEIVLFVDRNTTEEAKELYFGEGFLKGKRIYSEGDYPVYEGGETVFRIPKVEDHYRPLSGTIRNIDTQSTISISYDGQEKIGTIIEPGQYEAVFATNPGYFRNEFSGDVRVFTYRFEVIEEGTAPGPVVNCNSLKEYSHSTQADANPIYYGLTYPSAGKGYITLAFASKEAAVEYARHNEEGMVEPQADGTYAYCGPYTLLQPKMKYESNWDVEDAIDYYANLAVHELFFDMSDESTYLTLQESVLESVKNLRTLELENSIVIYAEGQKELLTNTEGLPSLNNKSFAYLNVETGQIERGHTEFQFVTDDYGGIDSQNVIITDMNGREYHISYRKSVADQLEAENCPSGVVTVTETTCYGDEAVYEAVYMKPKDILTTVEMHFISEGNENNVLMDASRDGEEICADAFSLAGIQDETDPYATVVIKEQSSNDIWIFTNGETADDEWNAEGKYSIKCINRNGGSYKFTVSVTGNGQKNDNELVSAEIQQADAMGMNTSEDGKGGTAITNARAEMSTASEENSIPNVGNDEKGREAVKQNNGISLWGLVAVVALTAIITAIVTTYVSKKKGK